MNIEISENKYYALVKNNQAEAAAKLAGEIAVFYRKNGDNHNAAWWEVKARMV